MARHLSALQPLWSFVSDARPAYTPPFSDAEVDARMAAVQRWSVGSDGRPRPRWTVGRTQPADA